MEFSWKPGGYATCGTSGLVKDLHKTCQSSYGFVSAVYALVIPKAVVDHSERSGGVLVIMRESTWEEELHHSGALRRLHPY